MQKQNLTILIFSMLLHWTMLNLRNECQYGVVLSIRSNVAFDLIPCVSSHTELMLLQLQSGRVFHQEHQVLSHHLQNQEQETFPLRVIQHSHQFPPQQEQETHLLDQVPIR